MSTKGITTTAFRRRKAWLITALLLSICAMQAAAGPLANDRQAMQLRAGETWTIDLPAQRADFLEVQNAGFDTIATALDAQGEVLNQSVTWRGRNGRYLLSLTDGQGKHATRVEIQNLENNDTTGNVSVVWLYAGAEIHNQTKVDSGLRSLALAGFRRAVDAHTHLARTQAIEAYQYALTALDRTNYADWRADIYFELGVLYRRMGLSVEAKNHYQHSLHAFQNLNNIQGVAAASNALGQIAYHSGKYQDALKFFDRALDLRIVDDNSFYQAQALNNIAITYWQLDDYLAASQAYELVLPLFAGQPKLSIDQILELDIEQLSTTGSLSQISKSFNNLALAKSSVGDVEQAETLWAKAIAAGHAAGSVTDIAQAELNLGKMLQEQGRLEQALNYLNSAVAAFTELNNDVWLAQAISGVGNVYAYIDEFDSAISHYQQALELVGSNQQQRAYILQQLANVNRLSGRELAANKQFTEARQSFADSNQPASAAVVASLQSMLLYELGYQTQALTSQREAMQTLQALGNSRQAARAQSRLGQLLLAEGRREDAEQELQSALSGHRAVSDELYELDTLTALSRAQIGLAALQTAKTATGLALDIRAGTSNIDIQSSFLASRRDAFEQYINLLIDAGEAGQAWAVNEQVRARSLLDLMEQSQVPEQHLATVSDAAGFQRQLAGDVAVLNYFLGRQRSHLWVVTHDSMDHYSLPAEGQINAVSTELTQVLRNHRQSPSRIAYVANQLSEMVLRPAADVLADQKLVIIADGSLQLVPFALLPLQPMDSPAEILVASNEVTYTPSAQIFAQLSDSRARQSENILVLADPLANIQTGELSQAIDAFAGPAIDFNNMLAQRSMRQSGVDIANLPGAQLEAAAIQKIANNGKAAQNQRNATVMVGAQASYDFVIGGGLKDYAVIHFATHGIVDADVPELSALILADTKTGQQAGYLRPQDIAGLQLAADLVVLSGCETGIGKSIGSEGLLSLSRPFLIAGARQVISSLWQVSDRATALLMERFYFHLLQQNQSPETALNSAQQWMRDQPQWQHPYYWAGFVLQGGHQKA